MPVRLQEFLHVKPGKGAAFVRTKIKNLVNGSVQEKTFRAGESIIPADVSKTPMQYTYTNGDLICFMNMETFEEQVVDKKKISNVDLLTEGTSPCVVALLLIFFAKCWRLLTQIGMMMCSFRRIGLSCEVSMWNEQVIDVQLPQQMTYTVVETPPNFKGNTAQGAQKPAKLNCGATVNVPMFIEVGEQIIVSTADCKYINRASSPTF